MRKAWKHYWPIMKLHKKWLILMLIGVTIGSITFLTMPLILSQIADLFTGSPKENYSLVMKLFWLLGIIWAIDFLATRTFWYAIINFECKAMRDLDNRCFQELVGKSYNFFTKSFTGSLVKKVNRFVRGFENIIDNLFFNFFQNGVEIAFIIIALFFLGPIFGWVFLLWIIVFLLGNYFFALWKLKYDLITSQADSKLGASFADAISNFSTVKIFAGEEFEQARHRERVEDWYHKARFSWLLSFKLDVVQMFLMLILQAVMIYLSIAWWRDNRFSVGDLLLLQSYILVTFQRLWNFGRNVRNLYEEIANTQEMVEIFETEDEIRDLSNAKELAITKGKIEFKNITFAHSDNPKNILENFNLTINPGEKVALVGTSGAGKTTIASLLFRFFDVDSGAILIDEQNIAQVSQKSLRQSISLVPQEPNLFHREIDQNIAYGDLKADQLAVIKAAKKAKALSFISELSSGFKTMVGERGVRLSGGERQRVAIARIILEKTKILIFDEATSALDSTTEKEIQEAMLEVMQNHTTIIIAHRLSTVKQVDRVIVIEDGQITEEGRHEDLLTKSGKYAELWSHQVGGFLADS
jgi:ATP-binding cassette subfamily B protein